MNLIDRIQSRLDDDGYGLQHGDFEDCATALLGEAYPGMAPVTGGTDHGLDAEIVGPHGHVLGLVVTSSRTWEGAQRSLRDSLKSARSHGRTLHQVMVANLAVVNQTKRLRLVEIARDFNCELVQVFDRAWFANAFLANPEWRQKVLSIAGGPSSLSRTPRGARPEAMQLSTIGRDDLLADVAATDCDVVLWGVPGAGKSHVAGKLPSALFLSEQALPERLLDDLLSASPDIVIVDDAGARAADVQRLWSARDAEKLDFRIMLTCWPHEAKAVADVLPDAVSLEVDLLSREELGAILRQRGITRTSVLAQILDQAQGRPAWAINLADLLVDRGDWQSVWSGQALREQILAFLRRSNAEDEAIQLLAAVALVGGVNEGQLRELAKLFALTPTQRVELIRSVAIAGLLDVRRQLTRADSPPATSWEDTYRVVPKVIAASIASDVYFAGRAAPVSIHDIKEALPELSAQILQSQIHAALLGAQEPVVPTGPEFTSVLDNVAESTEREELLRTYALVGATYTRLVDEYLARSVSNAVEAGREASALSHLTELAQRTAEAIHRGPFATAERLFESFADVSKQGWDCSAAIKALVDGVREVPPGEPPSPSAMEGLTKALAAPLGLRLPRQAWLELAARVLAPTFDGNYKDPETADRWVLQSFTWPAPVLTGLFGTLREGLAERVQHADVAELRRLIRLLEKFVGIAKGRPLPYGGAPTVEQQAAGAEIARTMAADLEHQITTPGLRAVFNRAAAGIGISLDEPDDLFRALSEDRDFAADWQEAHRRREANLDVALADYLVAPPEAVMAWLARHEEDFAMLPHAAAEHWVVARIAKGPNPTDWLLAALDHGLGRVTGPLVHRCIDLGLMTEELSRRMLVDRDARTALVPVVIADCREEGLVKMVVGGLSGEDLASLELGGALQGASLPTRELLFKHPNRVVRSRAAVLWAAGRQEADDFSEDSNWVKAMEVLEVGVADRDDWAQSEALKALARLVPGSFMDLLARHVEVLEGWALFDAWQESVAELSVQDRHASWQRLQFAAPAANLFWVLADDSADWIAKAVSAPDFPISLRRLLGAMQFQIHARFPLSTLARALRPLDWAPDDLLATLEVGMGFGTEHERLAGHLETCAQLAASSEADLAKLGARGVEVYQPRVAKAKAAARRAAVRGELGP